MDFTALVDQTYGPSRVWVSPDRVADFVAATGDDPDRWTDAAPPGFMSVALFAVAPDLLAQLYEHSVIHGEQSFTWDRPFRLGAELTVIGVVTKSRERAGVHFVTFEMEAHESEGRVAHGSALFLAGGSIDVGHEHPEPEVNDNGNPGSGQVAASRSDLVRYAAATRDWNPIHWDHGTAVDAGLPGVISHGLLQASWALRAASEMGEGSRPLESARVRFRNPLFPAHPANLTLTSVGSTVNVVLDDAERQYITARIETTHE